MSLKDDPHTNQRYFRVADSTVLSRKHTANVWVTTQRQLPGGRSLIRDVGSNEVPASVA